MPSSAQEQRGSGSPIVAEGSNDNSESTISVDVPALNPEVEFNEIEEIHQRVKVFLMNRFSTYFLFRMSSPLKIGHHVSLQRKFLDVQQTSGNVIAVYMTRGGVGSS